MKRESDILLVERLKAEKSDDFSALYSSCFPPVKAYVTNKWGTTEDAEDIFQETIIIFLQKIRQQDFVLTSSLKTYLVAIAKNIWLKRLRDNKIASVDVIEKFQWDDTIYFMESSTETTEEEKVNSWLTRITDNCRRILKAIFYYNDAIEAISKRMGWKNSHTAANQKYKCIEQVRRESRRSENS